MKKIENIVREEQNKILTQKIYCRFYSIWQKSGESAEI